MLDARGRFSGYVLVLSFYASIWGMDHNLNTHAVIFFFSCVHNLGHIPQTWSLSPYPKAWFYKATVAAKSLSDSAKQLVSQILKTV